MKKKIASSVILSVIIAFAIFVVVIFFLSSEKKVAGQNDKGWKVWVKTSPCSGSRIDWIGVAQQNPTEGGGGSFWFLADQIVSPLNCTIPSNNSCTFAEANAVANSVRTSNKFFDYCCRDSSVWENTSTGELSVVKGKFGTPGIGWRFVKGDLCCEEAEKLSGKTGLCGGTSTGGKAGLIGCFKDTSAFDLDGYLERSQNNTPQRCSEICLQKGFKYAGVQYGESCLCGNSYGKYGKADNCNFKCTGDNSQFCGGYNANSVYSTGFSGEDKKPPAEIDLAGSWRANIIESNTGHNFVYSLILSRESSGKWKGPFSLTVNSAPSLGFNSDATVESLGNGNLRITYFAKGKTQVGNGTYTKDKITFGGSQNTVVFTRIN